MFPVGFEPIISAGERPQNHALDRAATGTGSLAVLTYLTYEQFAFFIFMDHNA